MLTQEFNLNMVPDSEPVVIHVNQYDYGTGRFIIHLYDGDTAYIPASGATVKIEGEKPDGNVFSYSASLSGNTVTADVEIQMTAVSGRVPTQLIVTETGRVTGTFLFWMDVQESAINEKSPVSETEIPAIIEGAERQAQRAESAADTAVEASSEAETSKNSAASSAIAAAGSAANAKTSEDNAKDSEDNAAQSEKDAEAWARGTRGGVAVPSTDETYHNNSKYYSEQAEDSSEDSEAWAEGTRDGDPVPPTDPTYHHNAKYWAEQAQEVADIHLMDNETTGIGRPDGSTAEATGGVFSAIGTTIVASINPEATADYADDWLLDADDEVIDPDSRRQYRVTIRGKEMLFYWNGEEYAPLGSSGHTILNASALPMAGMSNLQFEEMSVENEELVDKTVIRQTQIVNSEAEWNQMLSNGKVDPNVTYYLPWMSSTEYAADRTPIGTVISVTTAKTGEITGITTPTGEFPSSDYLVCDRAIKQIADYPKLADWFNERYGSKSYFGGNGTTTFAVPDFTADFPTNGILAIKAQMASTRVTYAEVDDSLTTGENVWSAEKIYETIQILIEDKTYLTSIRNKNLGTKPTTEQMTKLANGDLTWAHNGDFWYDGTRYWEVLDNTLYLNRRGNTNYEKPHLIIKSRSNLIPAEAYLISADGLTKGYAECAYRTRTDGKGRAQCKTIINNWLSGTNGQIASHYELMSTANDASGATNWGWILADAEIESEVNITGHINWGTAKYNGLTSSGKFNIGSQWGQFMLYRLAPYRAINRSENRFLRDLVGLSGTVPIFSYVRHDGYVATIAASDTWIGLSPFFGLEAKS